MPDFTVTLYRSSMSDLRMILYRSSVCYLV